MAEFFSTSSAGDAGDKYQVCIMISEADVDNDDVYLWDDCDDDNDDTCGMTVRPTVTPAIASEIAFSLQKKILVMMIESISLSKKGILT